VFSEGVYRNGLCALAMTEGHGRGFFRSPWYGTTVGGVHLATRAVAKRVVTGVICLTLGVLVKCIGRKHAVCGGCVFSHISAFYSGNDTKNSIFC